jgi:LytS/YehU family sensor histidine kinase
MGREAATEIEQVFFAARPRVHALSLLRRRLQGLFGCSFRLEVNSDIGQGTTVTMRIPLQTESASANSLQSILPESVPGNFYG